MTTEQRRRGVGEQDAEPVGWACRKCDHIEHASKLGPRRACPMCGHLCWRRIEPANPRTTWRPALCEFTEAQTAAQGRR